MGETEESLEPQSVLSDLHDAVDAVFLAFENNNEWGLSGKRPDQYISDVVADTAVHELLKPLGYGILSEESELLHPQKESFPTVVQLTNKVLGWRWWQTWFLGTGTTPCEVGVREKMVWR